MEQTETIQAFITRVGLAMTAEPIPVRTNMAGDDWHKDASHWRCTIARPDHSPMVVELSQGAEHRRWRKDAKRRAWSFGGNVDRADINPGGNVPQRYWPSRYGELTEPTPPDLESVLDCLASDANGYDTDRDFAGWAESLGFDSDSMKAKACYDLTAEQAKALRHLLGNDEYAKLTEGGVERL